MDTKDFISLALVAIMFIGMIAVFAERQKSGKGIGARTIQITGVLMVVPLIGHIGTAKYSGKPNHGYPHRGVDRLSVVGSGQLTNRHRRRARPHRRLGREFLEL